MVPGFIAVKVLYIAVREIMHPLLLLALLAELIMNHVADFRRRAKVMVVERLLRHDQRYPAAHWKRTVGVVEFGEARLHGFDHHVDLETAVGADAEGRME
jgi:hypothetical protein